jgi:hypothetical protein
MLFLVYFTQIFLVISLKTQIIYPLTVAFEFPYYSLPIPIIFPITGISSN